QLGTKCIVPGSGCRSQGWRPRRQQRRVHTTKNFQRRTEMVNHRIRRAVRFALATGAAASAMYSATAVSQDETAAETTVVVTGTRITAPGVTSSSPIYSVGAQEMELQQQPEVEKIIRLLPITAPSDGQNANNGSAGTATVNLRGLGPQRNLLMIDGKRITPYNIDGIVDTSVIPTALI